MRMNFKKWLFLKEETKKKKLKRKALASKTHTPPQGIRVTAIYT